MDARRTTTTIRALCAYALTIAATGCAASGPLFAPRTADIDDAGLDTPVGEADRGPIRLVSFPSIDVLPLWPGEDEVSESAASVAQPLQAGTEAVKRGAGQIKQGVVDFGRGTQRALGTTTRWISRPLVALQTTPGEPSLLQRMFSSESSHDRPRTTREFLAQERVR